MRSTIDLIDSGRMTIDLRPAPPPRARRRRRGDVRRVVRRAGRPDPGAPAAHGLDRRAGAMRVGDLAGALGISQSTCSHHVRKLADVGFVKVDKVGTASIVSVNPACCTGLPHAADVVMGTLAAAAVLPGGPPRRRHDPRDDRRGPRRRPRHLRGGGRDPQRDVRDRGAPADVLVASGCLVTAGSPSSRAPWSAGPRSARSRDATCYAGVGETSVYVSERPAAEESARRCCGARSPRRTRAGSGRCRRRSFPRTEPRSPCTTRPATRRSRCARASPSSTASGATRCCSNAAARASSRFSPCHRRVEAYDVAVRHTFWSSRRPLRMTSTGT